jgi:hypothetical protein
VHGYSLDIWVEIVLAVFRVVYFLRYEDGPGEVMRRLRGMLGVREVLDDSQQVYEVGTTFISRLLLCPLCLSVWVSAVVFGVWWVGGEMVIHLLAVMGGAALLFLGIERWR